MYKNDINVHIIHVSPTPPPPLPPPLTPPPPPPPLPPLPPPPPPLPPLPPPPPPLPPLPPLPPPLTPPPPPPPLRLSTEAGEDFDIPVSVEVKGIKGTDGRHYVLDLFRILPPDANYNDRKLIII